MHSILTDFIQTPGVLAVCGGDNNVVDFALPIHSPDPERERYKQMLGQMLLMLQALPNETSIRVTLPKHSAVLQRNDNLYVGMVVVKGHPVVKSVQRMVRRGFRKMGGRPPSKRPTPRVVPDTPTPPATPQSLPAATSPWDKL